jgi:hypothetical protein
VGAVGRPPFARSRGGHDDQLAAAGQAVIHDQFDALNREPPRRRRQAPTT